MYTSNKKPDDRPDPAADQDLIPVVFQGDSQRVLPGFPDAVKGDLGYALYRLQLGQSPPDRRERVIQVLHCFEKRSNTIAEKDIETAKARLKRVLEAEREEKRNAKQALRKR